MDMDQDRQEAQAWALEWEIKNKRKRWFKVLGVIALIAVIYFAIRFVTIQMSRTVFSSAAEMRSALQGRYVTDWAEDIVIDGDTITLTYYELSHYDIDFARRYGYSEWEDDIFEDEIIEWDYREGMIRCDWMSDIKVDKDGNLVQYSQTFTKTTDPAPVPFDPALLYEDEAATGVAGTEDPEQDLANGEGYFEGLTDEETAAIGARVEGLASLRALYEALAAGSDAD